MSAAVQTVTYGDNGILKQQAWDKNMIIKPFKVKFPGCL